MKKLKQWDDPYNKEQDTKIFNEKMLKMYKNMVKLGHFPPREHSEETEFLSRQHVDFKTAEGMKQLIQSITWRVKIEEKAGKVTICVRKKKIPEIRRIVKEFGISGYKYEVKEIGWFECWFKRYQTSSIIIKPIKGWPPAPDQKQWCAFDLAKGRDYSAEATFKGLADGSVELVDMKIIKPEGSE